MKTFLSILFLLVPVTLLAVDVSRNNDLPIKDKRLNLGKYANDPFVLEGVLWFPYNMSPSNSLDRCECVQFSNEINKCITRRCWHIKLFPDGTVEKTLEWHGAK